MLPPSRLGWARTSPGSSPPEAHQPSGWDRYLSVLERNRVPLKQRRWYVLRAEDFIDAVWTTRMGEVSAEQITALSPRYAREQRLNEWHYRQTVVAVQLLLVDLAQVRAGKSVDWADWKEGGCGLEPDHPTIAKSSAPASAPRFAGSAQSVPHFTSRPTRSPKPWPSRR